jgi:hypothetical protein
MDSEKNEHKEEVSLPDLEINQYFDYPSIQIEVLLKKHYLKASIKSKNEKVKDNIPVLSVLGRLVQTKPEMFS